MLYGRAELFKYDMRTQQVESIYTMISGFEPYLDVEVDEKYIYLNFTEARHSEVYLQLDRKNYKQVDDGYCISKEENTVYKLKENGIYAFDVNTETSQLVTTLYPMYWYDDYKTHWAYKVGDWIYFNDYTYEVAYENRTETEDAIFRVNVITGQREKIEEMNNQMYFMINENQMDEEGYYYTIYSNENSYRLVKIKDKIEVLAELGNNYIDQLEYIKE